MSIDKYKAAQLSTENPRQTEYRLFADVTKALLSLDKSNSTSHKGPEFFKIVDWNRRVWLALQLDLALDDNQFPDDLKANLISISLWVDRQTREVMRGTGSIDSLITVNRTIMEGLLANQPKEQSNSSEATSNKVESIT